MSVLRKAMFLKLENSLPFTHIAGRRSIGFHDVVPFCKVLFLVSENTISQYYRFVIQLVVIIRAYLKT